MQKKNRPETRTVRTSKISSNAGICVYRTVKTLPLHPELSPPDARLSAQPSSRVRSWHSGQGSNLRPAAYKAAALPAELPWHRSSPQNAKRSLCLRTAQEKGNAFWRLRGSGAPLSAEPLIPILSESRCFVLYCAAKSLSKKISVFLVQVWQSASRPAFRLGRCSLDGCSETRCFRCSLHPHQQWS